MLTRLIGGPGNDQLPENDNGDGTTTLLRTPPYKACERNAVTDYAKLDVASLLNWLPACIPQ